MKINKLNYEAFALDYLEGTLSSEELKAMEQFLLKHPAIKAELDEMKDFVLLTPEPIVFNNKKQLLKETSSNRIVWMNPLRWSVAASILLAIMILHFSKTTAIDPTIATATPDEVIDKHPIQSTLPKETEIEKEVLAMDKQETTEKAAQAVVATNENSVKQAYKKVAKIESEEKEVIVYPTKSDESQMIATNVQSSVVAYTEEKEKLTTIINQATLTAQPAKETIQIAALSSKKIDLLKVSKEIHADGMNYLSQSVNTAIAKTPERRTLKSFIGKLPGNGVRVSIIPSFFAD